MVASNDCPITLSSDPRQVRTIPQALLAVSLRRERHLGCRRFVDFDAPSWLLADPRKAIFDLVNALEHLALAVADRPVLMDTEVWTRDVEREPCHLSDRRASGRMPTGLHLEVFRVC